MNLKISNQRQQNYAIFMTYRSHYKLITNRLDASRQQKFEEKRGSSEMSAKHTVTYAATNL